MCPTFVSNCCLQMQLMSVTPVKHFVQSSATSVEFVNAIIIVSNRHKVIYTCTLNYKDHTIYKK